MRRQRVGSRCSWFANRDLPGSIEQVFEIVLRARARIGAVTMIEHGQPGILGDPVAVSPSI